MNQNAFVATQYTLDGSAVPMVRCENCGEWEPKVISCACCHMMLCAGCKRGHEESQG